MEFLDISLLQSNVYTVAERVSTRHFHLNTVLSQIRPWYKHDNPLCGYEIVHSTEAIPLSVRGPVAYMSKVFCCFFS